MGRLSCACHVSMRAYKKISSYICRRFNYNEMRVAYFGDLPITYFSARSATNLKISSDDY